MLGQLIDYIENGVLPDGDKDSKEIMSQVLNFTNSDKVLYLLDVKKSMRKWVAVPSHLQNQILEKCHHRRMAEHFQVIDRPSSRK